MFNLSKNNYFPYKILFGGDYLNSLGNLTHLFLESTFNNYIDDPISVFNQLEKIADNSKYLQHINLKSNSITYNKEVSAILIKFINLPKLVTLDISNNKLGYKFLYNIFEIDFSSSNLIFETKMNNKNLNLIMNNNFPQEELDGVHVLWVLSKKFRNFKTNLK